MRTALFAVATLAATPALAHHEAVVATAALPLAFCMAGAGIAGDAAFRRWRKTHNAKVSRR